MSDLFGLNDRRKSETQDTYELSIAGGERKRDVFATTRKDAIHQTWKELDPDLGGDDWDEISIKRRRK